MKVSCSRALHNFSFNEDDIKSLDTSDLFISKAVPDKHYAQQGFVAYKKAGSRNKRLNLFGDFDNSFEIVEHVPRLIKPEISPTSKTYVTSRYPASILSRDLEHKISMLNAYHQLEELTDTKPKKPVITRTNSASIRKRTQRDTDLSTLRLRIARDICGQCNRSACTCAPAVPDTYLKRMSRLFQKARRSTSHSTKFNIQKPSSSSQRSRPQTSKSLVKRVPSNLSYDRPQQSKLLSLLRSATEKRSFVTELVRNIDEVA
mmetsp:Transcript_23381/g.41490  ORF Transcript_23381/g.41490 Transcript_23381/m.41490 type:complete len:260 (-) Transcript_23381:309-1088(-)